jgi:hypothetical protein
MFERTSPFTPNGVFVRLVLWSSVDDHGSPVIFRAASVRPKQLFDHNFDPRLLLSIEPINWM